MPKFHRHPPGLKLEQRHNQIVVLDMLQLAMKHVLGATVVHLPLHHHQLKSIQHGRQALVLHLHLHQQPLLIQKYASLTMLIMEKYADRMV